MGDNKENKAPLPGDTPSNPTERKYPSRARQIAMIIIVLSLQLLSLAADTALYPFFPATGIEKGLSSTEIGVVFSSFDFAKFIASPIFGSLLGKWHPKSMLAVGNTMTASACIAFGLVKWVVNPNIFLVACLIIRTIAGVGSAMLSVAAASLLMKSTSFAPSTIAGLIEATLSTGNITGSAIGAGLFQLVGYILMFCILGGLMLGCIPIFLAVVPKVVQEHTKGKKKGFISLMAIPGCLLMFVHCTVLKLNNTARSTEISMYLSSSFGTTASVVGLVFAASALVRTISSLATTRFIAMRHPFHMMISVWCTFIVLLMFFPPSPLLNFMFHGHRYLWLTITTYLVMNVLTPLLLIPLYPAVLDLTEVNGFEKDSLHTYGMVSGLINSGLSLGSYVGPVVSGAITDAVGFPWTITIMDFANMLLVAVMVLFLLYMKYSGSPLHGPADNMKHTKECDRAQSSEDNTVEQKIATACADKMNKCLQSDDPLTTAHQQQPEVE